MRFTAILLLFCVSTGDAALLVRARCGDLANQSGKQAAELCGTSDCCGCCAPATQPDPRPTQDCKCRREPVPTTPPEREVLPTSNLGTGQRGRLMVSVRSWLRRPGVADRALVAVTGSVCVHLCVWRT